MFTEKIIWFIDENENDLRTYTASLQLSIDEAAPNQNLIVKPILALANEEDYLNLIASVNTVAIFIDQKMKASGTVKYDGIDLAKYLRTTNSKLPIFILTSYTEDHGDFEVEAWNVEDIFPKSFSSNQNQQNLVIQRLLRHISVYQDIIDEREARFVELLTKSLSTELEDNEFSELERLRQERTIGIISAEVKQLNNVLNSIRELEALSKEISSLEKQVSKNE